MDSEVEELTLPEQPHREPALPTAPLLSNLNNRKRPFLRSREPSSVDDHLVGLFHTSSDPALFSSDDTPDAENYSPGTKRQKKKTYEGTWWGEKSCGNKSVRAGLRNAVTKKRQFRRNFDSGIFMCDDSSASELSSGSSLEQELLDAQQQRDFDAGKPGRDASNTSTTTCVQQTPTPRRSFKFTTNIEPKRLSQTVPVDSTHQYVSAVVQNCLRKNEENIDLTDLALTSLPPSITDLKSMIKRIVASSDDAKLAPFEAELKMFLGNNSFSEFPSNLLELTNIQILSIRQNKLSDLPTGIRNLVNLKELNISSNNLSALPFEVMGLLQKAELRTIQSRPNPWTPLPTGQECLSDVPLPQILTRSLNYLRRVAVGHLVEYSPSGNRQLGPNPAMQSKCPPLSEVVLRALSRHNTTKSDLSVLLNEYDPETPKRLLRMLHLVQSAGGRHCTFCDREMILPRSQWTEWWDVSSQVLYTMTNDDGLGDFGTENALVYTQSSVPEAADRFLEDRLLPFIRLSCGCRAVKEGLELEAMSLREWGQEVESGMHDVMLGPASWTIDSSTGKLRIVAVPS